VHPYNTTLDGMLVAALQVLEHVVADCSGHITHDPEKPPPCGVDMTDILVEATNIIAMARTRLYENRAPKLDIDPSIAKQSMDYG